MFILVEGEPVNKDLESANTGESQVGEWLRDRFSPTEFGIATNGFEWKLLKVSTAKKEIVTAISIDLIPLMARETN